MAYPNVGGAREQHVQPIDTDPNARTRRQPIAPHAPRVSIVRPTQNRACLLLSVRRTRIPWRSRIRHPPAWCPCRPERDPVITTRPHRHEHTQRSPPSMHTHARPPLHNHVPQPVLGNAASARPGRSAHCTHSPVRGPPQTSQTAPQSRAIARQTHPHRERQKPGCGVRGCCVYLSIERETWIYVCVSG